MTRQTIVETWKESGKYEEALALLQKTMDIEDEAVFHVEVKVISVNPDNTTTTEHVTFNRRCETIEVDETSASEETPTETPTGTDSGEDTGTGTDNGSEGESTGTDAGTTTEPGTDTGSGTDAETGGEDEVDTEGE